MDIPVKFIHCADLHLGSKFVGVLSDRPELGKMLISSTFEALDRIVDKAKEENVNFVLFSGDVFDESNETPFTRNYFAESLKRIGVPCYIVYGNHDFRRKWEDSIPLPDNAFVFPTEITSVYYPKESPEVEIIGVSYSKANSAKNHALDFMGSEDLYTIGMMHCDVDIPNSPYSPCSTADLKGRNVDYWALGHVHKGGILSKEPYIVYPGNTQGRNPKETGERGAYIVTVSNGRVIKMQFFNTQSIVWSDAEVSITGVKNITDLMDQISSKVTKGSIVRVTVTGTGILDKNIRMNRSDIIELIEARTGCFCSSMDVKSSPEVDFEKRIEGSDFIAAVLEYGKRLSILDKGELINLICKTGGSAYLRSYYEEMSADELRQIIDDSVKYIIEKLSEVDVE